MNIGKRVQLGGLAGVLIASAALAQTPSKIAPAQAKKEAPQAVEDESTQKIWDSDVARVGAEIRKLQFKLMIKEDERKVIESYMKGDYDAVRANAPEILKKDPDAIEVNEYLASVDAQLGDDAKACKELDLAIDQRKAWLQTHPNPDEQRDGAKHLAVLFGNRGASWLGRDAQRALADFDEALKDETPLEAMIMWEKSEALSDLHRYKEAAQLYAAAVEKDPALKAHGRQKFPDPTARNLCQVLAANGQNVQACN